MLPFACLALFHFSFRLLFSTFLFLLFSPALKLGPRPESSEGTVRTSSLSHPSPAPSGAGNASASPLGGTSSSGRAAPTPPKHRAEEEHVSPPGKQDTGASNTGADSEAAGRAEPLVPPVPKKKKNKTAESSPSKPVPPPEAPSAKPTGATTSGTSAADPQQVTLHAGRAAVAAGGKPSGVLGRITELKRGGRDLGPLLPYAERWNAADVSAATRGLGKDRLPALDPSGPRCTEEHFMRLRRAVKELDNAWHDATNNVVVSFSELFPIFQFMPVSFFPDLVYLPSPRVLC